MATINSIKSINSKECEFSVYGIRMNESHFRLWTVLLLSVFTAFVVLIGSHKLERFYVSSDQLLGDPLFMGEPNRWVESGNGEITFLNGMVSIKHNSLISTTVTQQVALRLHGYYRLSLEGSSRGVSKGQSFADLATVVLVLRDGDGNFISNHAPLRLYGTNSIRKYSMDIYIPNNVYYVDISVRLLRSIGTFEVSNLVFTKTDEFVVYKYFSWIVSLAAAFTLVLLLWVLTSFISRRAMLLVLTVLGVIGLGTLMPGTSVSGLSNFFAENLPASIMELFRSILTSVFRVGEYATSNSAEVSKIGHVVTFFILGIVSGLIRAKCGTFFVITLILHVSLATEAFQSLSLERSASIVDFYVDSCSGMTGLIVSFAAIHMWSFGKRQRISKKNID